MSVLSSEIFKRDISTERSCYSRVIVRSTCVSTKAVDSFFNTDKRLNLTKLFFSHLFVSSIMGIFNL